MTEMYFTGTQKKNQCLIIGDKVLPRSVYYFRKFFKLKPTRRGGFVRVRCPLCKHPKNTFCLWLTEGEYICEACHSIGMNIIEFHSELNGCSSEDSIQMLSSERPLKNPETYEFDVQYFGGPAAQGVKQ
jgi:hypothetical protein